MNKYIRHIFYILSSFTLTVLCINVVFKGLHDYGKAGMFAGLIISPILLIPIVYKMKWWIKLILIIALLFIPLVITQFITYLLYTLINETIDGRIDLFGYLLFYIISVGLIELALLFNTKQSERNSI